MKTKCKRQTSSLHEARAFQASSRLKILSVETKAECLWISYNLEDGTSGSWDTIGWFSECIGLKISKYTENLVHFLSGRGMGMY